MIGSAPVMVSNVWYKFFLTVSSLFTNSNGSAAASALLDTIGNAVGGMLSRFGTGWQEFVASGANQIPVMNPGVPVTLKTTSQLLDTIGALRGQILFRGAAGWQVLAPSAGGYLQSQGPGADPQYAASTAAASVATGLAATGTVQGDALVLVDGWNEVGATPVNSGVVLPLLGIGLPSLVFNEGVNTLKVYPPGAGQIDALGASAAYSLAAGKIQSFNQLTAARWRSTQLG